MEMANLKSTQSAGLAGNANQRTVFPPIYIPNSILGPNHTGLQRTFTSVYRPAVYSYSVSLQRGLIG